MGKRQVHVIAVRSFSDNIILGGKAHQIHVSRHETASLEKRQGTVLGVCVKKIYTFSARSNRVCVVRYLAPRNPTITNHQSFTMPVAELGASSLWSSPPYPQGILIGPWLRSPWVSVHTGASQAGRRNVMNNHTNLSLIDFHGEREPAICRYRRARYQYIILIPNSYDK